MDQCWLASEFKFFFNNLTKAGSANEIILKSLLEKKPLLITWFFLNQRNIVLKLFITAFFLTRLNVWPISYIRDFLMACLLVIGGGHRSDVIKNMTMEEWNERRIEKSPENESKQVKTLWLTIFLCFQHQP